MQFLITSEMGNFLFTSHLHFSYDLPFLLPLSIYLLVNFLLIGDLTELIIRRRHLLFLIHLINTVSPGYFLVNSCLWLLKMHSLKILGSTVLSIRFRVSDFDILKSLSLTKTYMNINGYFLHIPIV